MGHKDIFTKFKETQSSGGGNFIVDGKGVLLIKKFEHMDTFAGQQLTVEARVISSEPVEIRDLDTRAVLPPVEPNKPGSTVSYLCQFEKTDSARGNAKAITEALSGEVLEGEKFEEEYKYASDFESFSDGKTPKAEPVKGMLVAYETYRKKIQKGPNAGKPFTGVKWTNISEAGGNSDAEIAERRKQIEAGAL